MNEGRDFDYGICKIPRKDKAGNDISSDRIGKGGRHRSDGTYSGPVYDIKTLNGYPLRNSEIEIEREVAEAEYLVTRYENLPWYKQLIYDAVEMALPYVIEEAFDLAGQGMHVAGVFIKDKYTAYKKSKSSKNTSEVEKKYATKAERLLAEIRAKEDESSRAIEMPDEITEAYSHYAEDMTSEEAQKELLEAFVLCAMGVKKAWKVAHANILDSNGNQVDGQAMIDRLSSPEMVSKINELLAANPILLEGWQSKALEEVLNRKLVANMCYVPIESVVFRQQLMDIS